MLHECMEAARQEAQRYLQPNDVDDVIQDTILRLLETSSNSVGPALARITARNLCRVRGAEYSASIPYRPYYDPATEGQYSVVDAKDSIRKLQDYLTPDEYRFLVIYSQKERWKQNGDVYECLATEFGISRSKAYRTLQSLRTTAQRILSKDN